MQIPLWAIPAPDQESISDETIGARKTTSSSFRAWLEEVLRMGPRQTPITLNKGLMLQSNAGSKLFSLHQRCTWTLPK